MLPSSKKLTTMVDQAMQDRAPMMHKRLTANGMLTTEIQDRVSQATESYLETVGMESKESVMAQQLKPPMERIGEITNRNRAAAEIAMQQATEFPSENEMDSTTLPLPAV